MNKSKLQELCHQYSWNLPEYTTVKDGPDHNPRFAATVVVNGVTFETPKDHCRSSKEAQNLAAKLAFDHFTPPKPILQHKPISPFVHNTPIPLSAHVHNHSIPLFCDTKLVVGPANKGIFQPAQQENVQTPQANKTPEVSKEIKDAKDMFHLYKNRLQHYAQKKYISFPMYACELDGPPHARRYKSRVTIEGLTYEASEYFSTLKDAEHAAAKVAFESLSLDNVQEDDGLYKNLLQELAQKEGFLVPSYNTIKSGLPHLPTFVSTVELGGENFQGWEAKTKKQAEMSAAKAAYNVFTTRTASQYPSVLSPGGDLQKALESSSSSLSGIVARELHPNIKPKVNLLICEKQADENKGRAKQNPAVLSNLSPPCHVEKELVISSSCLQSIPVDDLQQSIRGKSKLVILEEQDEADKEEGTVSKSYKNSSSSEAVNTMQPFTSTSSPLVNGTSSTTMPSEHSTNNSVKSDNFTLAETGRLPRRKVVVYPRKLSVGLPEGATELPFSDEKWVAVKVEPKQFH